MESLPRANILGVGVSAINMAMALETIEGWIARREPHYVCVTGVHGVMESQRDEELRRIHNAAGLVTPDGMPLVWLSRLKGFRYVSRVYGPDLMLALCERSVVCSHRHFFYGRAEGVPEQLAAKLRQRFPGLLVAATYAPPFRPLSSEEGAQAVQMINEANPDVVWVGLSTPKQERWMAAHVGRVTAPVLIGVGAAFDFHAGRKRERGRAGDKVKKRIKVHRDLEVYQMAFDAAMQIFEVTKRFPKEEVYSLTDQIRRLS